MRPTVKRNGSFGVNIGTDWFERFADAYRIEAAEWLTSLSGERAVGPSAWDGLIAECVVEAALESLRARHPVAVRVPDPLDLYEL
jgi:predicted dehydrogenase